MLMGSSATLALGGISVRSLQGGHLDLLGLQRATLSDVVPSSRQDKLAFQASNPLALRPSSLLSLSSWSVSVKKKSSTQWSGMRVPGLVNLGNTCFMNSIFQALAAMPGFSDFVRTESSLYDKPILSKLHSLLSKLNVYSPPSSEVAVINPVALVRALCGGQLPQSQQDAHEFLNHIASTLSDELSAASQRSGGALLSLSFLSSASMLDAASDKLSSFVVQRGGITSESASVPVAVQSPMEGLMTSRISCESCGYTTPARCEASHILSLSLPRHSASPLSGGLSMGRLLDSHFVREKIDSYHCPRCTLLSAEARLSRSSAASVEGSPTQDQLERVRAALKAHDDASDLQAQLPKVHRRATRQAHFSRVPKSLCIHLSRVHFDGGQLWKNEAAVVPADPLNMAPFVRVGMPAPNPKLYQLVALVVHLGNEASGHFVTYRRLGTKDQNSKDQHVWLRISDEMVRSVTQKEVFGSEAYLLFYERI